MLRQTAKSHRQILRHVIDNLKLAMDADYKGDHQALVDILKFTMTIQNALLRDVCVDLDNYRQDDVVSKYVKEYMIEEAKRTYG